MTQGRRPDHTYTHRGLGGAHRSTYIVWLNMLARCTKASHRQFKDYGGRGIKVCERWKNFTAFLEDMGPRPDGLLLERENNDRGYEPDNCRWATRREQSLNTRRNVRLTFRGKTLTICEWAESAEARHLNLTEAALKQRVKAGWPVERILTEPRRVTRRG